MSPFYKDPERDAKVKTLMERANRRNAEEQAAAANAEVELSSWAPIDLAAILNGTQPKVEPTMLAREDGVNLIYPGKIHAFNAESEAGKSWLALAACKERIDLGEHVFFIDFEDDAASVTERLLLLGVGAESIVDRFHYWRPDEGLTGRDDFELMSRAGSEHRPTLVVLDGVTEAMAMHDWKIVNNDDAAKFIKCYPRRFAKTGAAVIMIDHLGRATENRNGHAIGAQHKKAGVHVVYELANVLPFGRGLDGITNICIRKDRPGAVRPHCGGRVNVGEMHLISTDDGVTVEIREMAGPVDRADWRPTIYMERVSRFLKGTPELPSERTIVAGIIGKDPVIKTALRQLIAEGYVSRHKDGSAWRHTFLKLYTEATDPALADVLDTSEC